ncbi:hypothetical protein Q8A67_021490 [Cirrhinus molitorella]|uniref:Uncharacterized protein n=1 Tax=Cirrhinus molitorella TaxID=172907 RepID=A0AA88PA13_9TELE|nr:hypothetical protein Q8A67_021490 [Cirrhinus molitorella]
MARLWSERQRTTSSPPTLLLFSAQIVQTNRSRLPGASAVTSPIHSSLDACQPGAERAVSIATTNNRLASLHSPPFTCAPRNPENKLSTGGMLKPHSESGHCVPGSFPLHWTLPGEDLDLWEGMGQESQGYREGGDELWTPGGARDGTGEEAGAQRATVLRLVANLITAQTRWSRSSTAHFLSPDSTSCHLMGLPVTPLRSGLEKALLRE